MLAVFLKYLLKTAQGIVPVLPAAQSFQCSSRCGPHGTASNRALSYQILLGVSFIIHRKNLQKFIRANTPNLFSETPQAHAHL